MDKFDDFNNILLNTQVANKSINYYNNGLNSGGRSE